MYQPTAECDGSTTLYSLRIDSIDLPSLESAVRRLVALRYHKARKQKGPQQGKGLQRTPGFISSVLEELAGLLQQGMSLAAVLETDTARGPLPRGGWTDVGMHTGHLAQRNSSWPLVKAVLREVSGRRGGLGDEAGDPWLL